MYNFNPSLYNYINFRFRHFQFCSKDGPTITAPLYLDNLADEIKKEKAEQKSVNKKSMTLAVVKRIRATGYWSGLLKDTVNVFHADIADLMFSKYGKEHWQNDFSEFGFVLKRIDVEFEVQLCLDKIYKSPYI